MTDTNMKYMDSSVMSLVEGVAKAQQKRTLTQMHIKETENKLTQATDDNRKLTEEARRISEREDQLKTELSRLNSEYRALQLLLMTERDQLHRCRTEEPLLQNHVNQKINTIQQRNMEWEEKNEQLKSLLNMLTKGNPTQSLKAKERQVITSTQAALLGKKKLEEELDGTNRDIRNIKEELEERRRILLRSHEVLNETFVLDSGDIQTHPELLFSSECGKEAWEKDEGGEAAIQRDTERRKLDEEWMKRLTDQHQMVSTAQRELEDMQLRFTEVKKWYTEKREARLQLEASYTLLHQCITSRKCPTCLEQQG